MPSHGKIGAYCFTIVCLSVCLSVCTKLKNGCGGAFVFHKHSLFSLVSYMHSPQQFLAPLAIGQRAYVMVCCPRVSAFGRPCIRPSVRALTFSLNIFFSETTYQILMKFHRNVPAIVLFRIC